MNTAIPAPATVLITGASSGLGRALAQRLAAPNVTLHLGGRDASRLAISAALCREQGAKAEPAQIDVTDRAAMQDWIGSVGRLDLVIANAGISGGSFSGEPEDEAQVRAIFATNLTGALNTALPSLAVMAAQEPREGWRGQIACVASIAAFIALPHAPSYCAAKAALDAWTVASAPQARRRGVRLISVCPGYVHTPMTAGNRFPMPGVVSADEAAARLLRGLARGGGRVVFPAWLGAFSRLSALLPRALIERATERVPGKQ